MGKSVINMRKLILLLAFAVSAQGALTTVSDTIKYADGTTASGQVLISWDTFTTAGGTVVAAGEKSVKVTLGVFSTTLEPNDTATPSASYTVKYNLTKGAVSSGTWVRGTNQIEYWVVPTSATAVTISSVRTATAVTSTMTLAISALTGGSAKGDLIVYNGTSFVNFAASGTDGQVLKSDSSTTSGLAWTNAMFNPMTALGDVMYGGAAGAVTRLAGNTTTTRKFLSQTGDGANSAAPAWGTIADTDVPDTISLRSPSRTCS